MWDAPHHVINCQHTSFFRIGSLQGLKVEVEVEEEKEMTLIETIVTGIIIRWPAVKKL